MNHKDYIEDYRRLLSLYIDKMTEKDTLEVSYKSAGLLGAYNKLDTSVGKGGKNE